MPGLSSKDSINHDFQFADNLNPSFCSCLTLLDAKPVITDIKFMEGRGIVPPSIKEVLTTHDQAFRLVRLETVIVRLVCRVNSAAAVP